MNRRSGLEFRPCRGQTSRSRDAILRHFDFGDSAEREEQFDQIFRGIFGDLAHDMADGGGYGRVEQNVSGLQSGQIHAHCLSRLKGSHDPPHLKLWCQCSQIANRTGAIRGPSVKSSQIADFRSEG